MPKKEQEICVINERILKALKVIADNGKDNMDCIFIDFEKDKEIRYTATDGYISLTVLDDKKSNFDLKVKITPEQVELLHKYMAKRTYDPYHIYCDFNHNEKYITIKLPCGAELKLYNRIEANEKDFGEKILNIIDVNLAKETVENKELRLAFGVFGKLIKSCQHLKIKAFGLNPNDAKSEIITLRFDTYSKIINGINGVIMGANF